MRGEREDVLRGTIVSGVVCVFVCGDSLGAHTEPDIGFCDHHIITFVF